MADFHISRHGYDMQEVDNFIKKLKTDYELSLGEQKDRIFELVDKVSKLENELHEYRDKDDEISQALLSAVKKANEIEKEAEERYDSELLRLKNFHVKWIRYYNEIKQRYPIDDDLMSVEKFIYEMNKILSVDNDILDSNPLDREYLKKRKDFLQSYNSEKSRLSEKYISSKSQDKSFMSAISNYDSAMTQDRVKVSGFKPIEKIGRYIASTASNKPQISDSGFDMNEVLNPSGKLDLGDICRELGLMNED